MEEKQHDRMRENDKSAEMVKETVKERQDMTMQQLLWQVQKLNKAGVPDAELDARYLLLEAFR